MSVQPFPDSHLWTRRYQRNNKQAGLKNIRCFPYCSDQHKIRGFCGNGVIINMSAKDPCLNGIPLQNLRCWAAFVPLKITSPDFHEDETKSSGLCATMYNYEYDVAVGQVVTDKQIKKFTRTPTDPFNPWFPGERVKDLSDPAIEAKIRGNKIGSAENGLSPSLITFSINRNKRGWHYGWIANKHTCDEPHILRAYICATIPGNSTSLRCIARFDSPSFTIFCRRRLRDHVADLPEQLKSIEHMQLRKKEFQAMIEQDPSILLKIKQKEDDSPLESDSDDEVISPKANFDSPPSRNKRKRLNDENIPLKSVDIDMSGENCIPKEKKLRKSGEKSETKKSKQNQNSNIDLFDDLESQGDNLVPLSPSISGKNENDFFLSLTDDLLIDGDNPFSFDELNEASMPIYPLSPAARPRSVSNVESKEDLVLRIMSALIQVSETNESEINSSSSLTSSLQASGKFESGKTEDFVDYLDSFLRSDVRQHADAFSQSALTSITENSATIAQSKNVEEVLRSLAGFLINETDFSNEISQALSNFRENLSLSDEERSTPKDIFISILEKHINLFLSKYNLTIYELDNMILASQHPKLVSLSSSANRAACASDIEFRLKNYTSGPNSLISPSQMKVCKNKIITIENRQETIMKLMSAINKTIDFEDLSSLVESYDDKLVEQYPSMNLTGNWRRPEATLKALEKLREHAGFPWLIRKMLKEMESTFEIDQSSKELKVLGRKKLLSSGFHSYSFDGVLKPFDKENPIPGENAFSNTTACAILLPACECVMVMQRYSDTLRLVRATTKNTSQNELQSVIAIQSRQSPKFSWHNQMMVNVRAIPNVGDISQI